jgi:phosphoglycolate phosphatase-like HAD superfamily hydrolase
MHMDRLVFWDIDGTLMHCGSDGKKALNSTFHELYGIEDAFGCVPIGGSMDSVLIKVIMESFGIMQDDLARIHDRYRQILTQILDKDTKKQVLPGVITLLETIGNDPLYRNALLTSNLKIGAYAKLESVGLRSYFEFGGFGDEPGEKWDAAEKCIGLAEKKYNTVFSRGQIYLIGDSCYDVSCAKRIGVQSVAVATGWVPREQLLASEPDYFFENLAETDRVLKVFGL